MASSSSACKNPAVPMAVAAAGDEIPPHLAAGQSAERLGAESRTGKRKAPATPSDEADLEMACEDSRRISGEIENLRSQLDRKVKELEYCEEIKKLRVELARLRRENQELKFNNQGFEKNAGYTPGEDSAGIKWMGQLAEEPFRDEHIHNKMEKLSERIEHLEELSGQLLRKERESNDELQEARKELIAGLMDDMLSGQTVIGIKRMGKLDERPFQNACRKKYGSDNYEPRAAELVSSWQEEIKKPSWHPFKIVQVDGEDKEVVNDDDPKLRNLWIEYGDDDVCNAVKTALSEVNECNASGRYVVPELWNFRKGQKATMKEVIGYIFSRGRRRARAELVPALVPLQEP